MALCGAADAGAGAVLSAADAGRACGELRRDRRLWRAVAEVHVGELSGYSDIGADLPALSGDTEIHRPDLVLHADHRLFGRVFPGLSCPQPVAGDRSVSALHGAVLDLEHHQDDFLDSVARQ